jgi:hypothetical protein
MASANAKLPATGTWDYLLIGASHARCLPPFTLHGMASRTTIVATDVHSHSDREWLLGNACALSTSEFLLTRSASNSKADITRLKLLKLLTLIEGDADTGALETVFREEAKLSYSLLRLVNSAALAPRSPITSFTQAINLLGRRQLQRWLQLLVYSDPNNGQHPTPLLQKAASRGRILELLVGRLDPTLENPEDTAFMIGTFSLLDVLLNMSMSDIVHQLPLPPVVHEALAAHDGALGQLLGVLDAVRQMPRENPVGQKGGDQAADDRGRHCHRQDTELDAGLGGQILGFESRKVKTADEKPASGQRQCEKAPQPRSTEQAEQGDFDAKGGRTAGRHHQQRSRRHRQKMQHGQAKN